MCDGVDLARWVVLVEVSGNPIMRNIPNMLKIRFGMSCSAADELRERIAFISMVPSDQGNSMNCFLARMILLFATVVLLGPGCSRFLSNSFQEEF
ncbi:MAG TPA: hypothetical protein DCM07_02370, partial [Planctomycetaceae bacterium]|nr:hypothetical protein [Planctomycetaceae bacterium]